MNEDTKKKLAALAALGKKKVDPVPVPPKKKDGAANRLEALNKAKAKQKQQPQVTIAPIQRTRKIAKRGRPTLKDPEVKYKKVTVRLPESIIKEMKMALLTSHSKYETQDEFVREAVLHFLKLKREK